MRPCRKNKIETIKNNSVTEIIPRTIVYLGVFATVTDEGTDGIHEGVGLNVAGEMAFVCDEAVDGCSLRDSHPPFLMPAIPEAGDEEVETIGVLAVKSEMAEMMIGNETTDTLGLLSGAEGYFAARLVSEEILKTRTTLGRSLRVVTLSRGRMLSDIGCRGNGRRGKKFEKWNGIQGER